MKTKDTHGSSGNHWIAVDLDGTLAKYDGWKGYDHIGAPVPAMLEFWDDRAVQVKPNTGIRVDGEKSMSGIEELEEFAKGGKGEGSRGGKVIGHTKSGKPIYESKNRSEDKKLKKLQAAFDKIETRMVTQWGENFRNLDRKDFLAADHYDRFVNEMNQFASAQADLKNYKAEQTIRAHESTKKSEDTMKGIEELEEFAKGGPYIGPRGGKWADPKHTIPWKETDRAERSEKEGSYNPPVNTPYYSINDSNGTSKKFKTYQDAKSWVKKQIAKQEGKAGWRRSFVINQAVDKIPDPSDDPVLSSFVKKPIPHDKKTVATFYDPRTGENDSEESEYNKSETAIGVLEEFVKSNAAGGLPTGEPKLGSGLEQGGEVDGKGKTSGSGDAPSVKVDAPKPKIEKLSEDDSEDEKALKPHKKPIETKKSMDLSNPNGQRESVAHQNAVAVSNLRKSEADIQAGVGVAAPSPEPEMAKSRTWVRSSEGVVQYSDGADQAAARLVKSDSFYPHGSPSLPRNAPLTQTGQCPACKGAMSKSLTACPSCGFGSVHPTVQNVGEVKLDKSEARSYQGFRPAAREEDLFLPHGAAKVDSE